MDYTQVKYVEICLLTNTVTAKASNGYPLAKSTYENKEKAIAVASHIIKNMKTLSSN